MLLCQFLVLAITTGKKKNLVLHLAGCSIVSVFGTAGNRQFFCCGGKVLLLPEKKKVLVVYLGGCAVVSVFGSGDYDRKKKVLVV